MKRAVICGRVNTKNQTAKNQTRELRKFARRHDWKITHKSIEHGNSGAKVRELQPEFNEMLKAAVGKEFVIKSGAHEPVKAPNFLSCYGETGS